MENSNRYWWFKLSKKFFQRKEVKKLLRYSNSTNYLYIYLKLGLNAIENSFKLTYENIESSFLEEIAYEIDTKPESVKTALNALFECKLISGSLEENELNFPFLRDYTGSETSAAERMREKRKRDSKRNEHCETFFNNVKKNYEDKEEEKDKEEETETHKDKATKFTKPTLDEVKDYAKKIDANIDCENFIDFYESKGWYIGKTKMKNWKACVNTWKRRTNSSNLKFDKQASILEINDIKEDKF